MTARFCVTPRDIRSAAVRIRDSVIRTPVVTAPLIDERLHAQIFFKCENLQHIGAFKARGACNAVLSLSPEEAAAGVVTHSSGNHAAALARAATLRNIKAHIVMPHNSAAVKISAVRRYGVEPTFCEPSAEARQATADRVMADTGATFVHPYNDARIIAGQGTAAVELFEDVADLDAVIIPVGGGGLLSGALVALKDLKPEIKVFAAEPEWADDAFRSILGGKIEAPTRYDTIADGLRTPLGNLTFPIIQHLVDEILTIDEDTIRRATAIMLQQGKLLVEPSGAVPLAAMMQHAERFVGQRVGVIVSGGNIDSGVLQEILRETPQS